jgi:hypothetical protein
MTNILKALINIAENPRQNLISYYHGRNRINNVGYALEEYVKDAFAGTITETSNSIRYRRISEVFSWTGNQNNPPDAIIRNGDAIEIKKIESYNSAIALNSSYPKHKLYYDDPKLTNACKESESWEEKDIIYCIGTVKGNSLLHLWFVYGDCYAASREIYERIKNTIKNGINSIPDVEFSETKELGRVNRVDPLGITDLRIRGMWHIKNPSFVFQDIYQLADIDGLQMACIMRQDKFDTFPEGDREYIKQNTKFQIQNIQIRNPDNPASLLNAVLITYKEE